MDKLILTGDKSAARALRYASLHASEYGLQLDYPWIAAADRYRYHAATLPPGTQYNLNHVAVLPGFTPKGDFLDVLPAHINHRRIPLPRIIRKHFDERETVSLVMDATFLRQAITNMSGPIKLTVSTMEEGKAAGGLEIFGQTRDRTRRYAVVMQMTPKEIPYFKRPPMAEEPEE